MKNKSLAGKITVFAILLVGCTSAVFYSFASPAMSQQATTVQRRSQISYAQLIIQGDDVTWDEGGAAIARVGTLDNTYRRLGGNQRTSLVNLLNEIGNDGWELVEVANNVWTFKR